MKIKRNNTEYELTPEELREAYFEQEKKYNREDLDGILFNSYIRDLMKNHGIEEFSDAEKNEILEEYEELLQNSEEWYDFLIHAVEDLIDDHYKKQYRV